MILAWLGVICSLLSGICCLLSRIISGFMCCSI